MPDTLFIVVFHRTDDQPDEEYCYANYEDAVFHFGLFENDDSGLYHSVELLADNGEIVKTIGKAEFVDEEV